MAVTSEVTTGPRCLRVRLTGEFDQLFVRDAERMFRDHLEACAKQGLKGLLYDVREVQSRLGTVDVYETAKSLASASSARTRIGVLARPDQISPERFFEQVAINRGAPVKIFTQEAEVLRWLGCDEG